MIHQIRRNFVIFTADVLHKVRGFGRSHSHTRTSGNLGHDATLRRDAAGRRVNKSAKIDYTPKHQRGLKVYEILVGR